MEFAPVEEPARGPGVRLTGVPIADVGGEELDELPGRVLTGGRDHGRQPGEEVCELTMRPKDDVVMVQNSEGVRSDTVRS